MDPQVAIIILNWKRSALTLACLESVASLNYPPDRMKIVVVDNASRDGSVEAVCDAYPGVVVIENSENLGYAGGNNVGIRWALKVGADFILILNNDVLVSDDILIRLLSSFIENPQVAVATPLIIDSNDSNRVWSLGASLLYNRAEVRRLYAGQEVSSVKFLAPFPVDIAPGSALMVKANIFTEVGLMDEAYFLFYEEGDWCLAVGERGFKIYAVPQAAVQHKGSATIGKDTAALDYYMVRNRLRFIRRNWHGWLKVILFTKTIVNEIKIILVYTLKHHQKQRLPHRNARLRGIIDALLNRYGPAKMVL